MRTHSKYEFDEILESLADVGVSFLTNRDNDAFLFTSESFKTRYKHENATVGDIFYDANNGDKHRVEAVRLSERRIIVRNLDQNTEYVDIYVW